MNDDLLTSICRSFNGAKDMKGFRETFNLSFGDENNTSNCDSDIEDSTILVSHYLSACKLQKRLLCSQVHYCLCRD